MGGKGGYRPLDIVSNRKNIYKESKTFLNSKLSL